MKDPSRTATLFQELFDARVTERVDEEGHREKYIRLGGIWMVLVEAPVERARTGDHIAFRATRELIESVAAKLHALGHEVIRARSDRALYFFDYDNHLFELDSEDIGKELGG